MSGLSQGIPQVFGGSPGRAQDIKGNHTETKEIEGGGGIPNNLAGLAGIRMGQLQGTPPPLQGTPPPPHFSTCVYVGGGGGGGEGRKKLIVLVNDATEHICVCRNQYRILNLLELRTQPGQQWSSHSPPGTPWRRERCPDGPS